MENVKQVDESLKTGGKKDIPLTNLLCRKSRSSPTKTMTASASLGILARSFMDLAAAGWDSGGRGWRDFLEKEQNADYPHCCSKPT